MDCRGRRYFHVYTKGLEDDIIFKERADFIAGMNYVPVAMAGLCIDLLAFVLMSNHFHFIIYADKHECERFIDNYKRLVSRYVRNKYGTSKILRAVKTSCCVIEQADEGLKRLIAYVLNNPVKAGINCMPQNYEWGSGRCYFTNYEDKSFLRRLSEFGVRQQIAILRSGVKLNQDYIITDSGYIDPQSYIDFKSVERIFVRARSMEYFLSVSNKTSGDKDGPVSFSDSLVLSGLGEILEKKYGVENVSDLSIEVRRKVVLEIRKQFNSTPKQLARVLKCSLNEIIATLEH